MASLSKERWAVLGPLLDQALELDRDDRAAWLERLRAEQPDLAAELDALLAPDTSPLQAFLDASPAPELWGQTLAGQSVGKYTLDQILGRGGMATVWLAHRTDGRFEGQVAVKLLHLSLLGRAGAERFAQEGTVLARLTHPNIARLLDAGVTPAGQPFLVLEHVVGTRIDEYADARHASSARRIDLCLQVLAALASAHANLIIHRDIKPSNILVTPDGNVKLLDFGIAKLLLEGRLSTDPTTLTELGGRALTPEYAAPELVLAEPVSTATDVYSAGVLLYTLLSGVHPTGLAARTAADHIRSVLDVEPPRLSDAVAGPPAGSPAARIERAAARGSTPARLRRLYAGDLDNILAKALKKEPADRYQTVVAFADDLQRYRRHQPVSARRDAWGYRARKFLRRHRTAIAATALVAVTLVGSTAFSARQMVVARRERDRAADALRRSEATTQFEALLFRLLEPGGEALTYRQLLDKGREVLERQFRGDPVSRMQLGIQFAQNYLRERDADAAFAIVRRAVGVADSVDDARWRARTRCELAFVLAARGLGDSARLVADEGHRLLAGLRDVERGTLNACDGGAAEALMALGQSDSAAPLFRAVAQRFAESADSSSEDHLLALNDYSRALFAARRIRAARDVFLLVLDASRTGALGDPASLPILIHNGSVAFETLGEVRDQQAYFRREIAAAAQLDSAGPHYLVAFDYGMALSLLQQADSAAWWLQLALDRMRDRDPARAFMAYVTLARLARTAGHDADAARYERAAAGLAASARRSAMARAIAAASRMDRFDARGDSTVALALVTAELDSLGYGPDATSRLLVTPLAAAAAALVQAGAYGAAADYADHLVRIGSIDSLTADRSAIVGHGLALGAEAAVGRGDVGRARDLARRAVPPLTSGLGPTHPLARRAAALRDSLGT